MANNIAFGDELMLCDFGIDDKDIAILIAKNISWNKIPNGVILVGITAFIILFGESYSCHIGFNFNCCSRNRIFYQLLSQHRHNGAAIKACETMQGISCFVKKIVMPHQPIEQAKNTSCIQEIINLVNNVV